MHQAAAIAGTSPHAARPAHPNRCMTHAGPAGGLDAATSGALASPHELMAHDDPDFFDKLPVRAAWVHMHAHTSTAAGCGCARQHSVAHGASVSVNELRA